MNEMTLPSGHRIRNSNPGGPSTSTLPLGQGENKQMSQHVSSNDENIFNAAVPTSVKLKRNENLL